METAPIHRQPFDNWLSLLLDKSTKLKTSLAKTPALFSMSEGWNHKSKGHPEHLFYFVLNGSFQALVNGEKFIVDRNSVAITPAHTSFNFRSDQEGPIELYRFRVSLQTKHGKHPALPTFLHINGAEHCLHLFEQISHETEYPNYISPWKLRGLLLVLLSELSLTSEQNENSTERTLYHSEIRKIRDYFHRNHIDWPQPGDLAAVVELSSGYFTKVFKRTFGISPRRWIVEERIRLASLYLMESGKNISEVSETFGYSDVFFFSQQFKKITGLSPSGYIKRNRAEPAHLEDT